METLSLNFSGSARRVTENGVDYLVAPITAIVPGVLPGSRGPLLYPADECRNTARLWDRIPITVGHPQDPISNRHLSADDPYVLDRQGVGETRSPAFNGKTTVEGWFDEQRVRNYDSRNGTDLHSRLVKGVPTEASTGLYTDNEPRSGSWRGAPYSAVARNHRPDHLAVLLNEVGACSVRDGCGVNVNAKKAKVSAEDDSPAGDSGLDESEIIGNDHMCWGKPCGEGEVSEGGAAASKDANAASAMADKRGSKFSHESAAAAHQAAAQAHFAHYAQTGHQASLTAAQQHVEAKGRHLSMASTRNQGMLKRVINAVARAFGFTVNPAVSEAQRKYLNSQFGHDWVKEHGFDNKGELPETAGDDKTKNRLTQLAKWLETNQGRHLPTGQFLPKGGNMGKKQFDKAAADGHVTQFADKAKFEPASQELHEDDAAAELIGKQVTPGGRQQAVVGNLPAKPFGGETAGGATDDHQNPKSGPAEIAAAGKRVGIKNAKDEKGHGSEARGGGSYHNIERSAFRKGEHVGYGGGTFKISKYGSPGSETAYRATEQSTGETFHGRNLGHVSEQLTARAAAKRPMFPAGPKYLDKQGKPTTEPLGNRRHPMTKEQIVNLRTQLVANCDCDERRQVINALDDETLQLVVNTSGTIGSPTETDQEGDEEDSTQPFKSNPGKGLDYKGLKTSAGKVIGANANGQDDDEEEEVSKNSYADWMRQAPAEVREAVTNANEIVAREKQAIAQRLVVNSGIRDPKEQQRAFRFLVNKGVKELRQLASLYPQAPVANEEWEPSFEQNRQPTYEGAAGGFEGPRVYNQAEDGPPLELPVMNADFYRGIASERILKAAQ